MIFESMFNLENGSNSRDVYATPMKNSIESQLQPSSVESVYLTPKSGSISMTPRRNSLKKSVKKTPKFKIYGDIQNEKIQNTRKLFDDENICEMKPYRTLSNKENENPDGNRSTYYTPKMHKLRYSLSRGNSLNTLLHSTPIKVPNETFKDKYKNLSMIPHNKTTERKQIFPTNRIVEEKIPALKNFETNKNNELDLVLETPKILQLYPNDVEIENDVQKRLITFENPCKSKVIQSEVREVKWRKKRKFSFPRKAQVLKRSLSWRLLRLRLVPTRRIKFPRPFILLWSFAKTQSKKLKTMKRYFVRSRVKKESKYFSSLRDNLSLIRKDCKCKCTNENVPNYTEIVSRLDGLDADIKEIKSLLLDLVERSSGTKQLMKLSNMYSLPPPPPPPPPLPSSPLMRTPLTINKRASKCATTTKLQSDNIFSITVNDIKNIKLRKTRTLLPAEKKPPVGADPRSPVISLEMLQSIKLRKPGLVGGKRRQTFGGFDERERLMNTEDAEDVPSPKKSKMGLLQRKYRKIGSVRGNIDND